MQRHAMTVHAVAWSGTRAMARMALHAMAGDGRVSTALARLANACRPRVCARCSRTHAQQRPARPPCA
eukprot:2287794-Pleurochrysis_carterae.AAC.1